MTKTGTRFQKYIEFTSLNGGACESIGPFENGWLGGSGGPDGFGRSVRLAECWVWWPDGFQFGGSFWPGGSRGLVGRSGVSLLHKNCSKIPLRSYT